MTTADWALVVSLFSFVVSLAGFIWNVWSKFVYPKAKVRSYIAVMNIVGDGTPGRKTISLSATNYGPTDITLYCHISKETQGFLWFRRNRNLALINPVDHPDTNRPTGFFPAGFPKKLTVGEGMTVYFSPDAPKSWVENGNLFYFGFSDTFGRYHWCSRENAKKFRKDIIEAFGAVEPKRPSLLDLARTKITGVRAYLSARVTAAAAPLTRQLRRRP